MVEYAKRIIAGLLSYYLCCNLEIRKWAWAVWGIVGILTFLSGFVSGNVVTMVVGVVLAFGYASSSLTSYVKSDHIVKRALEVFFMLLAFGVVIYGYILTGSLVLGVMTIFIVTMVFVAFLLSYFLPRIQGRSKGLAHVKGMKEKDDLAYNAGTELGMEMRRRLEENWRSCVIAGVIAVGCGLLFISLKSAWFIVGLSVFISYGIAYYSLSKLFEKIKG